MEDYKDRIERIKEAAYYDSVWVYGNLRKAFVHGAEWADHHPLSQWISCGKRLPPFDIVVLVRVSVTKDFQFPVSEMQKTAYRVAKLMPDRFNRGEWYFSVPGKEAWLRQRQIGGPIVSVIEWMPIVE